MTKHDITTQYDIYSYIFIHILSSHIVIFTFLEFTLINVTMLDYNVVYSIFSSHTGDKKYKYGFSCLAYF